MISSGRRLALFYLKSLVTIAFASVISVALLEGLCFFMNSNRPPVNPWERKFELRVTPTDLGKINNIKSTKIQSSVLSRPIVNPSAPKYESFRSFSQTDHSREVDPPIGVGRWPLLAPNYSGRSRVTVRGTNQVVFDVSLSTDSEGRRATLNPDPARRSRFIAVFGCSFAWGYGVGNEDTLPSQIAKNASSFMVYNYGALGGSPMEALTILERDDFEKTITKNHDGYGIYVLIPDQIRRVRPSISYISSKKTRPYFDESSGDELTRQENYSESHPFSTAFFEALGNSQTLRFLGLDFPWLYGDREIRYLAKMLRRLTLDWEHKFHNRNFVVVLWPDFGEASVPLKNYLDSYGVPYLDYSSIPLARLLAGRISISEYEGHPSSRAHAFLGAQIASDLGLGPK